MSYDMSYDNVCESGSRTSEYISQSAEYLLTINIIGDIIGIAEHVSIA